jgi:two-component system, LytTR family, sensor kinase
MKLTVHPTKAQWLSLLIIMPFICFLLNNLLFCCEQLGDYKVWLFSFPIIYALGVVSWYLQLNIMHWLRQTFTQVNQTMLRLLIAGLLHFVVRAAMFTAIFYSYDAVHFLGYELNEDKLRFALYCAVGITLVGTGMWEADYSLAQWRQSISQKQQLEQLTLQQEFEALKNQVNPHFLFNCLNTLSSLINEDHKRAENFLNELSKVYRYLLRNNEDGLSTLQTELKFIESYYKLLRTRHGDAVQLQIDVDKKYEQYLLPSLSLQLLIENVVKHNVLSKNKPLQIDIFTTTGNKLVVSNNIQLRLQKAPSNGVGLDNIRSKYKLLNQPGFQVLDEGAHFSVVLPLLWSKTTEQLSLNIA